jgi:hypothetical protein
MDDKRNESGDEGAKMIMKHKRDEIDDENVKGMKLMMRE